MSNVYTLHVSDGSAAVIIQSDHVYVVQLDFPKITYINAKKHSICSMVNPVIHQCFRTIVHTVYERVCIVRESCQERNLTVTHIHNT